MVYVALLRGINVGGKNRVEMSRLKSCFEKAGLTDVSTYINSGNVVFSTDVKNQKLLVKDVERAIKKDCGLEIKVLLRNSDNIKQVVSSLPDNWVNDSSMKCDVMFLWDNVDKETVLNEISTNNEIEDIKYVPGAIIWRIDRSEVNKSRVLKIIGTDLYKNMTIRNCNTVRKLFLLMSVN